MKIKDKIQLTIIAKEAAWKLITDNAKVSDSVENKTIVKWSFCRLQGI